MSATKTTCKNDLDGVSALVTRFQNTPGRFTDDDTRTVVRWLLRARAIATSIRYAAPFTTQRFPWGSVNVHDWALLETQTWDPCPHCSEGGYTGHVFRVEHPTQKKKPWFVYVEQCQQDPSEMMPEEEVGIRAWCSPDLTDLITTCMGPRARQVFVARAVAEVAAMAK